MAFDEGARGAAVTLRAARAGDLPRLTEIYNHYIVDTPITFDLEPFSVEERRPWFARYSETGPHRLLVAERGGAIAGYTSSSRFHARAAYDTTVEMTILCAPEHVGYGIGAQLYEAIFAELQREESVHSAMAAITLPNRGSCALHERFGFRRVGVLTEVGRKFGRYWDVAWYERRMRA